jgi:hypothetical protein
MDCGGEKGKKKYDLCITRFLRYARYDLRSQKFIDEEDSVRGNSIVRTPVRVIDRISRAEFPKYVDLRTG